MPCILCFARQYVIAYIKQTASMEQRTFVLLIINTCVWGIFAADPCFEAPKIRPNENVTFLLTTRETGNNAVKLPIEDPGCLVENFLVKTRAVKILIHGYSSDRNSEFNLELTKALLIYDAMYVISVDWAPLTRNGCRPEGSLNTRVVGNCTAQLIDLLVQKARIPLKQIHLIGFSMGGATTAFVSEFLTSGKVKHITALDPTLPYFNTSDLSQRLDKSDGDFVDVIHTAAGTKGQVVPCGHADFYMNGGREQPGCEQDDQLVGEEMLCSHRRAPAYYAESVNSNKGFYGQICASNKLRLCSMLVTTLMGYHVNKRTVGVYKVETAAQSPFALGQKPPHTHIKSVLRYR